MCHSQNLALKRLGRRVVKMWNEHLRIIKLKANWLPGSRIALYDMYGKTISVAPSRITIHKIHDST